MRMLTFDRRTRYAAGRRTEKVTTATFRLGEGECRDSVVPLLPDVPPGFLRVQVVLREPDARARDVEYTVVDVEVLPCP